MGLRRYVIHIIDEQIYLLYNMPTMPKKLTLIASDFVAFYGALALVLLIRYGMDDFTAQWGVHVVPFTILLSVWILALYIANLYEARIMRNDWVFFERLGQAILVATIASLVFFYLIPFFDITPKLNLFLFLVFLALLMWGVRALYNTIIAGGSKKRIIFIGICQESLDLAHFVVSNPQLGYRVSALVPLGQESLAINDASGPWQILDDHTDLISFIGEQRIDIAVIAPHAYGNADIIGMLYSSRGLQMDFASLAPFTERLTGRVPIGAISQQWFLENISENSKRTYETVKRVVDISVALVLGTITLALTPFILLAIWLDSPGYPFIHQRRTGMHGTPFMLYKFRSMIPNAEKHTGAVWAGTTDSRITRVGSFLRKTRIDELPQLWNVLRGDISLVGPRAERPEFDAQLAGSIPFYFERYFIKPGLSGWAQINYPYGSSVADALEKLQYDLYYTKHRSFALDIEILLKTISISLRRAGR